MISVKVFDPAMCCSTGVCGPGVDPQLARFAADLEWLAGQGVRLTDCDLWVTLEPCGMCAAAISFARVRRLYYAAEDPKGGGVAHGPRFFAQPTCHHRPEVVDGLRESEAAGLLKAFFAERR